MKKFALFITSIFCFFQLSFAANGDSTVVRAWDKFHMSNYGAFDTKVLLPSATQKHQRIWLKYTLGCLSNGQCEWDYDIALFARRNTGVKDSTLNQSPFLKVNGTAKDSVVYSNTVTWVNTFNSTTKKTDSVKAVSFAITLFGDSLHPLMQTDSFTGYTANYYRYWFDSTGAKTDSSWITATDVIYQHQNSYYTVFDVYDDLELGRLISPYAKQFPKSFQYEYVYDVTDYAKYLSDSTELRIFYSGYSYGFTATWELIYIEGTPAKEVIDIVNIYNGGYQYGGNPGIETSLSDKSFTVPAGTASVKAKILITGHGGESNENCAEFCAKNYYLRLNNQQIAQQLIWRDDCGANPITAQGGTWIYDRANWCPGESIRPFEYDLNVAAGSTNIMNMDMDDFTANGFASYKIAFQVIYYKNNTYQIDAGIEDILAPSRNNWYSKTNPICDNAQVILKNWGAEPLTDAWISCTLGSGKEMANHWSGNLKYGEEATVSLPNLRWATDLTDRTFTAWITSVNGKKISADENTFNNKATSSFDLPITLPKTFIVETRTNAVPEQNSYTITDSKGTIYKTRTFSSTNTLHRDTITLDFGCYTFKFNDDNDEGKGSNGLGWWAAPGEGNGSLRIITPSPTQVLKTFSVDFGTFTQLNFRVDKAVGIAEQTLTAESVKAYPSPASTILFVEGATFTKATLFSISGKEIAQFSDFSNGLDIQSVPTGMYILELMTADKQVVSKKICIQK